MLRQGELHQRVRHLLPAAPLGVPPAAGEAALVPQGDLQQCTACSHGQAWQADMTKGPTSSKSCLACSAHQIFKALDIQVESGATERLQHVIAHQEAQWWTLAQRPDSHLQRGLTRALQGPSMLAASQDCLCRRPAITSSGWEHSVAALSLAQSSGRSFSG